MACIRDETPLAGEPVADPGQHLVERFSEPRHLVSARRDREPVVERRRRDVRRTSSHRFDRAQCRPGETVAGERGEEQGQRAADQECIAQAPERLRPVLSRCADDKHQAAGSSLDGYRQQPRRLVELGGGAPIEEHRTAKSAGEIARREKGRAVATSRRVENRALGAEQLRKRLSVLHEGAAGGPQCSFTAHERRDVLRA